MVIKKAIIPIAGLGTRFLPLSKEVPKELWPLVDKPVLQYVVEEAIASGIKEIIFVSRPEKKMVWDYFAKADKELERILKERKKEEVLKELKDFEKIFKGISFAQLYQKKPLGDGHAILQAKKKLKKEAVAVLFGDDVIEAKEPGLKQMIKVFQKYKKPVLGLAKVPKEKISSYGVISGKKLKGRIYRVEKIVEKPKDPPSNLAIVGRYLLTPEVFEYLKKTGFDKTGEIRLAETLEKMIKDKKEVLGYEFKGKWLECGNKMNYLKSLIYLSLKHPKFGQEIKNFLKKI